MNEAFLFTLGIVLVGIPGGALLALLWTHPGDTWRGLKKVSMGIARLTRHALRHERLPRTLPDFVYKK